MCTAHTSTLPLADLMCVCLEAEAEKEAEEEVEAGAEAGAGAEAEAEAEAEAYPAASEKCSSQLPCSGCHHSNSIE
jgi:hypothetical protein